MRNENFGLMIGLGVFQNNHTRRYYNMTMCHKQHKYHFYNILGSIEWLLIAMRATSKKEGQTSKLDSNHRAIPEFY